MTSCAGRKRDFGTLSDNMPLFPATVMQNGRRAGLLSVGAALFWPVPINGAAGYSVFAIRSMSFNSVTEGESSVDQPITVAFHTLGCKVSQYETEAIREAFLARGFSEVAFTERADVYVINTCTVTAESDRKSRQMIRRAVSLSPDAVVMVTGCYSQTSPEQCAAIPGVAYVGGSGDKMKIPDAALRILAARHAGQAASPVTAVTDIEAEPFEPMHVRSAPRTRAYVKIEDGCECRCTYCAIPAARGRVRSKAPEDVLKEVNALVAGGTREVVLTGIETASYGVDLGGFRLIDLLTLLERDSPIERIRLGSLTPELFREPFVTRLASLKKPVPHFHISMQSGSDAVLRAMHRRYNSEQAMNGIRLLRTAYPRLMLTTDMMVGFPGETEENFRETLSFSREAHFLSMHVFAYSRRKNTPAASYPHQIPEDVKHERVAELMALSSAMTRENLAATVENKTPLSVLFETYRNGFSAGHSENFIECAVRSDRNLHGAIANVIPLATDGDKIIGEIEE